MKDRFIAAFLIVAMLALAFFWAHVPSVGLTKELSYADIGNGPSSIKPPSPVLSGSELGTDEQTKALTVKVERIITKVKQVCANYHLEFVGPTDFTPKRGIISDSGGFLESADDNFGFSPQLDTWQNYGLERSLNANSVPSNQKPPSKPEWSEDKATKIGKAFSLALLDGAEIKLGESHVNFRPDAYKNGTGEWTFAWDRVDSQGHKFYEWYIALQIPEGYGPASVQIPHLTPYIEPKGTIINQAKALAYANRACDARSGGFHAYIQQGSTSPEVFGNRLMWVFYVPMSNDWGDHLMVDAYTGDYLWRGEL